MKKSTASFLRFLGIWLSFILASSLLGSGAWLSALFAIALLVVVGLTNERYPFLTVQNKTIIISILSIFIALLFIFQWRLNA